MSEWGNPPSITEFRDHVGSGAQPAARGPRDEARGLRVANATPGFGLPLSNEGMKLPNKIGGFKRTQGTETSQYLEERRSTDTPLVVASERGPGQWRTKDNRNSSGKLDLRG
jgi:hypothetical protein